MSAAVLRSLSSEIAVGGQNPELMWLSRDCSRGTDALTVRDQIKALVARADPPHGPVGA